MNIGISINYEKKEASLKLIPGNEADKEILKELYFYNSILNVQIDYDANLTIELGER